MAERDDQPEGWSVPQRPAIYGAAATIAALTALLLAAGHLYNHHLRQSAFRQPLTLPSPGLETAIHPAASDPHLAKPPPSPAPDIAAAKRRLVKHGLAGWEGQP